MESNTISKSKSKINVKLIAITANVCGFGNSYNCVY